MLQTKCMAQLYHVYILFYMMTWARFKF